MSVSCQKIDPAQWPRSESFAFFSSLDQPFYSVCFRVDVTALHAYTKANGLSFYHSMVWLVTQAVNETENLRYHPPRARCICSRRARRALRS